MSKCGGGERRGQRVAALDAVGAGVGAFGMLAFSIAVWMLVETSVAAAFVVASVTWLTCRCRSVSATQHAHRLTIGKNRGA